MEHQYRNKPVVIGAFQMTEERRWDNSEWPEWLHRAWNFNKGVTGSVWMSPDNDDILVIATLEGVVLVKPDDWIIQGIKGELYPCKPDIFEATYEEVVVVPS